MTDSGGPQRHTLCFLSTLLSQKVPEKSDTVLRCMIAGQPKPEVTWYKNGQTIEDCSIVSSYEFFENQYIHVLHLYCCSKNDAAVYQISAKNCSGMICCSAFIEVECLSENPRLSPNLKDNGDTGWKHGTETDERKRTNQNDKKEPLRKEEESPFSGAPRPAGPASSTWNHLCSLQSLASSDTHALDSGNLLEANGTRRTDEACDPNNTEEITEGLLFPNASNIPDQQDACCHRTIQSEVPELTDGALNDGGPNDEDVHSSHRNPEAQKYISVSLPLSEAATSIYPGDRATVNIQVNPQGSSQDSDSDYELCPEITLTYTEEFSDDDLEYLECSDVMTDYSNAVWQRDLQGTEHVFLLESDDEVMEFSECCLGECQPFLSEMGSGPGVSDNTGLMEATAGFCGHHSQPQEVRLRHGRASTHTPSSPHGGMTLTLGPQQDEMSTVTDQGRAKRPLGSAENDYPGIQGETRDSHHAGEEFASGGLRGTDRALTEMEVKPLSGELGKSGTHQQRMETTAGKGAGEKDPRGKRRSEKPDRARRPGVKGTPKQLTPRLKDRATEGTLQLLYPTGPDKHPLTQSEKHSPRAKAEATDLNCHLRAGEGAIPTQAEQETKPLQTPPGARPKEGNLNLEGEAVQVNSLFETSWVPDQSDHPQVQIQETVTENISLSQMPAFSEPAGEQSAFTGTTTNSLPNLGGIGDEHASLAQHLQRESCTQGPEHEETQAREDNASGHSWEDLGQERDLPEPNHAKMSRCELSVHLPQEGSTDPGEPQALSVPSSVSANIVPTLETVCHGPRDREVVCVMEHLEAGDQGACDTRDSPVGAPVDKYLPQGICSMDLVLAGSQSQVPDSRSPDDKTPEVLSHTRGSEPPQSTGKGDNDGNTVISPPPLSTLTRDISQEARKGAPGENPATVENFTSAMASLGQASQERLGPSSSGGPEERQPLPSEKNSLVGFEKGSNGSSSGLKATDTAASPSSTVNFPQEKPTPLTANPECLQVTWESGDTSPVTIATKVHPAKYLPVSMAGNSHADGPEASSPQAPGANIFQLPSNVQLGHTFRGSTTESPHELLCMAPGGPGGRGCVPRLPEGEGFCSDSPRHADNQSGDEGRTTDRADVRSLESFQGKGTETTHRVQQEGPRHQGSLSEHHFQEGWPMASAAAGEVKPVPWDHSLANSAEEGGQRSGLGTGVSVVAKATVEDDSQAVSSDPLLSKVPPEELTQSGPGHGEAGSTLTITALEASVSEVCPSGRLSDAEGRESEAGAAAPDGVMGASAVLKAGAAGPGRDPPEVASPARSPQAAPDSARAGNREIHRGEQPAGRAHWSSGPPPYLSPPGLLESSVDPVDEKELCGTDVLSEGSETGGQEHVNNESQKREENQLSVDHPVSFTRFLTRPKIRESSVDPLDETGVAEWWGETQEPSPATLGLIGEETAPRGGGMGQGVDVLPVVSPVPCPLQSGGPTPRENTTHRNQEASERGEAGRSQHDKAEVEVQPAASQVPRPDEGGEAIPSGCSRGPVQEGRERRSGEAEQSQSPSVDFIFSTLPLSGCLAMTPASVGVDMHNAMGQIHEVPEGDLREPRNHQGALSDSEERGAIASECGTPLCPPGGLTQVPFTSSPEGNITDFSISLRIEEPEIKAPQTGDPKPPSAAGSPVGTLAFISGERASGTAPKTLRDSGQPGPSLGRGRESGEGRLGRRAAKAGRAPVTASKEVRKTQGTAGSGYLTDGVKKKILSRVAALRLRLEEKESARKNSSVLKKIPKRETSVLHTDEKKDPSKLPCKGEGKAPVLLKKIHAERFPDHSGNVTLNCQFAEIHEDSTICWTKDAQPIAQAQRSAGDTSTVSLVIVQAAQKDQGLYHCCLRNSCGKVTAEFNLTAEVLRQLSSAQDTEGCEEIEFSQLIFKEDFLRDSYFGDHLRGQIATEELHFGEGVHRKAFRSKVMRGLMPVFQPGHACVLKVHNAVAYGTRNNDELIQRNYKLAAQECYVQNTARYYAKIYAAEAQPLEGFGEVPEIIPIFLIHRPENNIPYATVEEELIGEFVKYSIRDGKEINFLRRESEAGQKCCTFQHWVYQKTGGCLLVTDMQGVGMKLTDVGIATLAKGYKGFKGNCSMTFIDQFKALHQCNKYCKMLGLTSLQNNNQKQKKPSVRKNKPQPSATTAKMVASGSPADKTQHPE